MKMKNKNFNTTLHEKISTKNAIVGVIGLGYVGLPLACELVHKGYRVVGFDKNNEKIANLKNGISYIADLPHTKVKEVISTERFDVSCTFSMLSIVDIIIICVPTPTTADGTPDISYIMEAAKNIQTYGSVNTLVILESTTYPGTTREVFFSLFSNEPFHIGENLFIAYSPERVDPGNQQFSVSNTPKIVGGITEYCRQVAAHFYKEALETTVYSVTSPEVAEMEKLLENTFRQVNIALVNELSQLCYRMGIDVWEVIQAASTKPYGFMPFAPGPGVGGHCIPVDPKYLLWSGKQHGIKATLIEAADKINESMPQYVVERLSNYLMMQSKPLHHANIVIIGVAYKPNINDIRESPAIQVIDALLQQNCTVAIIDSYIESFEIKGEVFSTTALTADLIGKADGVLILTNHSDINYQLINEHAALIFDTRNTDYPFTNTNYFKL